MTSRRALKHYEQRVSRMEQFIPGHVGGRVDSAQPVVRRGGTLRRSKAIATPVVEPPTPSLSFTGTLYEDGIYGGLTYVVFAVVSPADGLDLSPPAYFDADVLIPGSEPLTMNGYSAIQGYYGASPWTFLYDEDTPITVTDSDWYLAQGVGSGGYVWYGDGVGNPGCASLTITLNGVDHVGVFEDILLPDWEFAGLSPILRFPTLPLPFTFAAGP